MPNVGYATLSIVPSMRGVHARIRAGLSGVHAGTQFGDDFGRGATPRFTRFFSSIGRLALQTGAIVAAGGAGLAAWGLKSAGEMQQTEIAFEGILGSGEKAKAFLDDLRSFAAKTPFEFPELARSSKLLLATGFAADDILPTMTKLGNVAATLGVGGAEIEGVVRALGQMRGKGKASAEELQQISEQIPGFSAIKSIAEGMGISTAEAFKKMEAGAIPADQAIDLILEGMEKFPGAAGAMQRQSQTLLGVLSTLKDTARDALIGGLAPALPALASSVQAAAPAISEGLTGLASSFGGLIQGVVELLPAVLPVVSQMVSGVGSTLGILTDAFGPVLKELSPLFGRLMSAIGPLIGTLARTLAPIVKTLGKALLEVGTAIARALLPVFRALGPVITPLARAFAQVFRELAKSGAIQQLGQAVANLVRAFLPLIPVLVQALRWLTPIIVGATQLASILINFLAGAVRWVIQAFTDASIAISGAWAWIKQAASDAWNFLNSNVFGPMLFVVGILAAPFKVAFEAIELAFKILRNAMTAIWEEGIQPIWRAFKKIVNTVGGAIEEVISKIEDAAAALKDLIGGFATGGNDPTGTDIGDFIPGLASGGDAYGFRWVGEQGPELAWFGRTGGHVWSNPDSQRIASAMRTSDAKRLRMTTVQVNVRGNGDDYLRGVAHQVAAAVVEKLDEDIEMDLAANGM